MTPHSDAARYLSLQLALVRHDLDAALREATGHPAPCSSTTAPIERDLATIAADDDLPARWLSTRLGLTPNATRVLWLLMGYEVSAEIRSMVMTLAGGRDELTLDLAERITYGEASAAGWRELGDDGPLLRLGLVRADRRGEPRHRRRIHLEPSVRGLLHGEPRLADELRDVARTVEREVPLADLVVSDGVIETVGREMARPRPFLLVTGGACMGRATLLRAAALGAHLRVLEVACDRLAPDPEVRQAQLRAIVRDARLFASAVLLKNCDALVDPRDVLPLLAEEIDGPVLATAKASVGRLRGTRQVTEIKLAPLPGVACERLWQRAIPTASESDAAYLSSTYPLAPAIISAVASRLAASTDARPTSAMVIEAIRATADEQLSGLAERVEVSQDWSDLVLPDEQLGIVAELLGRVRERRTVYEQWGFARKLGKGLAISAVFSGPPGTGKTMTASLIAKDLGLPLYRVDLAQMVSKYIGETEKNLARLFDAAQSAHAVLLFDEADSLFGKRTEVKSSNDRYANLEVNYMLQRLETFTGICLLTTNHEHAIDDAFRRRIAFHVRFPIPDEDERTALWRAMIPAAAPVASELDHRVLARHAEMSGGHIRNAVLRAAFAAAGGQSEITMAHLRHAADLETEAMGKVVSRSSTL